MFYILMQWLCVFVIIVVFVLVLGILFGVYVVVEDFFFIVFDCYGVDDFSVCVWLFGELLQCGGCFFDGGELLLVECMVVVGDCSQVMDYVN